MSASNSVETADTASRAESDALTTSDGAVRQLEKADQNAAASRADTPPVKPDPAQDPDFGEVISLGKGGDGAPEEEAADIVEFSPDAKQAAEPARTTL